MSSSLDSWKLGVNWNRRGSLSEHYDLKIRDQISEGDYYNWVWLTSFTFQDWMKKEGLYH